MEQNGKALRSGELASLAGVSTDTLRHYERLGLLPRPKRSASGYRLYAPDALKRVQLIRGALSVGFSLAELGRILPVRDRGGAPCKQVRALAAAKLEQIDQKLEALLLMRKQIETLLAVWDQRLQQTPDGERAGLLDMLFSAGPPSERIE